ncbi:transposase [Phytohabitans flavus]|uniref:transposase n=1 Tax=Phytohabitans flavus TaxID=1076124 RepID=UPI003CD0A451
MAAYIASSARCSSSLVETRPAAGSVIAADRAMEGAARLAEWAGCDSTFVAGHSDKQGAQSTFKRTFGFVSMCAFVDHGEYGTGETLITQLRPGKASPWAKTDHIQVLDAALAQLPAAERAQVLVRADSGACSQAFLHHITDAGLEYSIGFPTHLWSGFSSCPLSMAGPLTGSVPRAPPGFMSTIPPGTCLADRALPAQQRQSVC